MLRGGGEDTAATVHLFWYVVVLLWLYRYSLVAKIITNLCRIHYLHLLSSALTISAAVADDVAFALLQWCAAFGAEVLGLLRHSLLPHSLLQRTPDGIRTGQYVAAILANTAHATCCLMIASTGRYTSTPTRSFLPNPHSGRGYTVLVKTAGSSSKWRCYISTFSMTQLCFFVSLS